MNEIWIDDQIPETEWNEYVASIPSGHLLQTSPWAKLKSNFGWKAQRIAVRCNDKLAAGAQILFRSLALGWTAAYVPKGPLIGADTPEISRTLLTALNKSCRAHRAIFCKIEPEVNDNDPAPAWVDQARALGFRPAVQTVQPHRTIVLDISQPKEAILKQMKSKTRYNIRLSERKGVRVHTGTKQDLATFGKLMGVTGERDDFGTRPMAYYERAFALFEPLDMVRLFIATVDEQPIAGVMVFACGQKAWYMFGASGNERRETMPNYALQWAAIRWAQANGCTTYDLYGVPDHDREYLESNFTERSEGLWGVYRFKRGFGGQLVRYVGAFDCVYNRPLYWLYTRYLGFTEAGTQQ